MSEQSNRSYESGEIVSLLASAAFFVVPVAIWFAAPHDFGFSSTMTVALAVPMMSSVIAAHGVEERKAVVNMATYTVGGIFILFNLAAAYAHL